MVQKKVEQELEKRKEEIEADVLRRVEEAKKVMEKEMMEEMEKRRQILLEEEKKREVGLYLCRIRDLFFKRLEWYLIVLIKLTASMFLFKNCFI